MWFPRTIDIRLLHDTILDATGGQPGILVEGAVASAIERARWGPFEGNGDLAERAALLLRGIAQDHPFADGNKRTAWEAMDAFLRRNGQKVIAEREVIVSFMLHVAQNASLDEIQEWIRSHLENV